MKKLFLIFSFFTFNFLLLTFNCVAQVNLVTNPSFENLSSCPNGSSEIYLAIGWNTPIMGGGGNPDLFNVCCTDPSVCGVPENSGNSSFQYPHSGNGDCGIQVMGSLQIDYYREYIQSKLITGLSEGHTYCVTFYASLSNQSNAYIKPLGAYFDNGSISAPPLYGLASVTPQVYNTTQSLNDTLNWIKIEGSFVATGNETYITLGNFFPDSTSNIVVIGSPTSWFAYYYIDDVSVIDAGLPAFAGNDTLIHPGDSTFIGRQLEVGLNEDCIWFVNNKPIDTIAGMWVKPDSTTAYILEQTICGNVSHDTVTVYVSPSGINHYSSGSNWVRLFPNPVADNLTIETPQNSTVEITNLEGQIMKALSANAGNTTIDVSALSAGMYFIEYKSKNGVGVRKFMKE